MHSILTVRPLIIGDNIYLLLKFLNFHCSCDFLIVDWLLQPNYLQHLSANYYFFEESHLLCDIKL